MVLDAPGRRRQPAAADRTSMQRRRVWLKQKLSPALTVSLDLRSPDPDLIRNNNSLVERDECCPSRT